MKLKLSIIIPCYNCEDTLTEAVDSCYRQNGLENFEIVMVDDGSIDNTREIMQKIANEHKEIKLFYHDKNRGGGAARNTGIKKSTGDLIFCLDSDNFFAQNSVQKMIDYLEEKKCDGVAVHERRFFVGNNSKKYTSHFNKKIKDHISIEDIFITTDGGTLLDNFLFTKESYFRVGGYPENHGFDTQDFEIKFLAANNKVYVCPGLIFYHRQSVDMGSYFQRVYKSGLYSRNFYFICEDIMYLFSRETRMMIMEFDIFQNTKLDLANLKAKLDIAYKNNSDKFFIEDKEIFMNENGNDIFLDNFKDSSKMEDVFCSSVIYYKKGSYEKAMHGFISLLKRGFDSKIIYFNVLRSSLALTGKYELSKIEDETAKLIENMLPKKQKLNRFVQSISVVYVKLLKLF